MMATGCFDLLPPMPFCEWFPFSFRSQWNLGFHFLFTWNPPFCPLVEKWCHSFWNKWWIFFMLVLQDSPLSPAIPYFSPWWLITACLTPGVPPILYVITFFLMAKKIFSPALFFLPKILRIHPPKLFFPLFWVSRRYRWGFSLQARDIFHSLSLTSIPSPFPTFPQLPLPRINFVFFSWPVCLVINPQRPYCG